MQQVKQTVVSLVDKLRQSEHGISLPTQTTGQTNYPAWLRDIFTLFAATYGNLWNEQFLNETTGKAVARVWFFQLKEFESSLIRQAILQAGKIYKYPPKPAELIEILRSLQHRKKDAECFREHDNNRLLEKPAKQPVSREVMEKKAEMWRKLKRFDKEKDIMDALSHMDLQEK
jgi:hypothetical protein